MPDVKTEPLLQLADRCEQATGPDRELDLAIAKAVGRERWYAGGNPQWHFTASLDAAMTLVPEGRAWGITTHPNGTAISYVSGKNRGEGTTPALALAAAALCARAADRNTQDEKGLGG